MFLIYELIAFQLFMGIGEKIINQSCAFFPRNIYTEIDKFIMINYDRFYKNFVEFWSSHNTFYPCKLAVQGGGDDSLCSAAIICDGHRKIRRRLCANPNVPLSLPEYFVHLFKPSESRKQVIQALANLYTIAPMLTKIVIYDSGCLLAKSVRGTFADGSISNEHNNSPGVKALTEVRFFVDRFHLSNHKD
ncbi:unnamed protein product, partial [Rotaria sp. Silwood1]